MKRMKRPHISFCYWFQTCGKKTHLIWFQSFYIYRYLSYGLAYGLSWTMFHVHLKRLCVLKFLNRVCYRCLLDQVGLLSCSSLLYYWWFSVCFLSITENVVLKSPIINVELSLFFFQFCQFLIHEFWGFVVRHILIYNCLIFLIHWLFYYKTFLFVSTNISCHRSIFSDVTASTPALLWFLFLWYIFLILLLSTCLYLSI